jgi:hypothetical protein
MPSQIANGESLSFVRRDLNAVLSGSTSIFHYIPQSEWAAIQARTSTYDIYADLMSAINDKTDQRPDVIAFPQGQYKCSNTIHLKRQVYLHSFGSGISGGSSTEIVFPAGVAGFVLHAHNTSASGIEEVSTGRADGSIIEGILLKGGGGAPAHGVWLRTRATLKNVQIHAFSGNGLQVLAASGSADPATEGNANNFIVDCCAFRLNGAHGMYVDGPDANAGLITGSDADANGGCGFYDSSFLGNTYVGCHTAENADSPYKSDDPNARNLFVGCYGEGDQPYCDIAAPAMFIGGAVTGFTSNTGVALKSEFGYLMAQGFGFNRSDVQCRIGGSGPYDLFTFTKAGGSARRFKFDASTDDIYFDDDNLGAWRGLVITGNDTMLGTGGGRPNPFPRAWMFDRLMIGGFGANARMITTGLDAPTSGEWAHGDRVYHAAPSPGGIEGWVCTVGGTAGSDAVFKTFGTISA